jgi:hypothetical protein
MKWGFYSREKFKCPECGEERFVRMINEKGEFYPENVGRCDRENSCGYMYHASQWLKDNPQAERILDFGKVEQPKKTVINGYFSFNLALYDMVKDMAQKSNRHYQSWNSNYASEFRKYLINILHFTSEYVDFKMNEYKIYEEVKMYYENNIERNEFLKSRTSLYYYYVSTKNDVRAIEQIHYDGFKRSKTIHNRILNKYLAETMQNKSEEEIESLEINWCLFGEHLLNDHPEKPIIVVEGVKTAFGMALFYPEYNWLATGSANRLIHLNFSTAHKVYFLPDAGINGDKSYAQIWKDKIKKMYGVSFKYDVYEFNDDCSSDEIKNGCDILDVQIKDPERAKNIITALFN